jgi:TPR repeat protein
MSSKLGTVARVASLLALLPLALAADTGDQLYRDGHYARAIEWWRTAAEAGSAHAAYRLGVVHADGVVVKQDLHEAAHWYQLGAARGDREAQFDLATLYDNGYGVEKSYALAAKWYRASAERGEPASQYNLATMYEQGHGVERDLVEAYKWYTLAAQQGFIATKLGGLERLSANMTQADIDKGMRAARAFEPID